MIAVFFKGKPQVFLNPKILRKSRKTDVMEEGCLSFPGLFLKIKIPPGQLIGFTKKVLPS